MKKPVFQIFAFIVLTGLSVFVFQVGQSSTSKPLKENDMITAKKMFSGLMPPIDAAAPSVTRTATFALG